MVVAEQRANKLEKKLEINPEEANMIRLIFEPYRRDSRQTGSMGFKAIVDNLNRHGYPDKNIFGCAFRKVRMRAGVRTDLTFQDIRRSALTEMGNRSATNKNYPRSPAMRQRLGCSTTMLCPTKKRSEE